MWSFWILNNIYCLVDRIAMVFSTFRLWRNRILSWSFEIRSFFLSWFMVFKLSLNVIWITEQLEMCQYIFSHAPFPFVVNFSFSHDCNHFYMSIWSTVYMRKYVLYWTRRQKKPRRSKCLALVPVVSNTFCEELVMVHDDVHTAISKRILWNISSRWYVHSPYNGKKAILKSN